MHGISFRPRANIVQPVRGRAFGNPGAPVCNPRHSVKRPPRCTIHARRRPVARVRPRVVVYKVSCRCMIVREPDPEGDLLP